MILLLLSFVYNVVGINGAILLLLYYKPELLKYIIKLCYNIIVNNNDPEEWVIIK